MKSLCPSSLKSVMRFIPLFALLAAGTAATAVAQNPRIQTSQLDALASRASQTVDVNLDESMLQLAKKFLSKEDKDEASVKDLVNGLKGIYVKSFEFEKEGEYSPADLESIRSQLHTPGWNKIVNVNSKKEGGVEVYVMQNGSQIGGLAVLASDPKEITVINIIGPVDLEKLTQLEGQFGIPELQIERSKPRRRN